MWLKGRGRGSGQGPAGEDLSHSSRLSPAPLQAPSPSLLPQSRDRKMVGDVIGAQSYASTAKCLNIWALVLGLLGTIGSIVLLVLVVLPVVYQAITRASPGW